MARGGFGGFPGGGNMNNMIKQAQKMQQDMLKKQQELEEKEVEVSSGGGAVTIRANGKQEVLSVKINPSAVDPDDVEMLEDLVLTAINQAMDETKKLAAAEMSKLTSGINIPGLI